MIPGKISISRITSNIEEVDYLTLQLKDESSRVRFLEVRIPFTSFVMALTGMMEEPITFYLYHTEHIGKVRETKEETVLVPRHTYADRETIARLALEPYEVDGWVGYLPDALNHTHRTVERAPEGNRMRVSFHRYVDPPTEDEDAVSQG